MQQLNNVPEYCVFYSVSDPEVSMARTRHYKFLHRKRYAVSGVHIAHVLLSLQESLQ